MSLVVGLLSVEMFICPRAVAQGQADGAAGGEGSAEEVQRRGGGSRASGRLAARRARHRHRQQRPRARRRSARASARRNRAECILDWSPARRPSSSPSASADRGRVTSESITLMQGSRPERVGDQIRAELSELLAREVKDPGIGFVTITHVKVSADLQVARAYYTTLGDAQAQRNTAKALERATPFLRRQIAGRLRLAPRAGARLPVRRVDRPRRSASRALLAGDPRRRATRRPRATEPATEQRDEPSSVAIEPHVRHGHPCSAFATSSSRARRRFSSPRTRGPTAIRSARSWRSPRRCARMGKRVRIVNRDAPPRAVPRPARRRPRSRSRRASRATTTRWS